MNLQEIISSLPLQAGIFILLGLACFATSVFATTSYKKLNQSGLSAEGIIYKLELDNSSTGSTGYSGKLKDKITVRFLTSDNVWVTGEAKSQFLISFTGQYKEGAPVKIKYNPDQPEEFILVTRQSEITGRLMIIVVGILFITVGLYQWFRQTV
jgi:Protein of unknown function (DUF3592)